MKETFTITDHLNKKLYAVKWASDVKPKGVVLIVHGLAEHSERYSHFKPNRTDFDWLSRDTDMVDLYIDDPLCGFICSNSFYHQLFKGINDLHSHHLFADHNPDIPILLISGNQDPVSNMGEGIRSLNRILRKNGVKDITTHLYNGGRHEMLNEINRDEVFDNFLKWLNQKIEQSKN